MVNQGYDKASHNRCKLSLLNAFFMARKEMIA
jgi:hypothetical protein